MAERKYITEARRCSVLYRNLFFFVKLQAEPVPAAVLKKETRMQVFCCEFYEIFKNMYFFRQYLRATASSMIIQNQLLTSVLQKTFSEDFH